MHTVFINKKLLTVRLFLPAIILMAGFILQSCSKKSNGDSGGNKPPTDPVETATLKYIPDSVFRAYLKANICPNAFDKTGKFIDITNSEVKNFNGTMQIDTLTCPRPFATSLKGVEYFTQMKKLIVKNGMLDSLDLSKTMALDTIRILSGKDLQYFVLSGCTSMRYIRVTDIPAVSLDMSNLPELNYINLISLKRLGEIKTDNDAKLRHLMTYGLTSLKTVNVSTNANLGRLFLESCSALNSIDVTHNLKLYGLMATYCPSLKTVDLSKNDSLEFVQFEDAGVDTVDFTHNPNLFAASLIRVPIRNLSLLSNPKVCIVSLDGCTSLKAVDLRAQKTFDYYRADLTPYSTWSSDDQYQLFQHGFASPVPTAQCPLLLKASRNGVDGATQNLYAGLRMPQYLDENGLSLTQVKLNKAVKDNYSLVMARRVLGNMTPVLVTVYDDDMNTVVCPDYSPELFKCN